MLEVVHEFPALMAQVTGKKHLLLGNGFSRACRNNVFSYDSLFAAADFHELSDKAKEAFNALGTTDFEVVMRAMQTASQLVKHYEADSNHPLANLFSKDAEKLRRVLVQTIAQHHPAMPSELADQEYVYCRRFLAHFDKVYSLNYDLLLYWATMKKNEGELGRDDGFRDPYSGDPEDYFKEGYVEWANREHQQNVHYLHGALHIFYVGASLQKYCWNRTGIRILEQIDGALKDGKFPLIVAEGSSSQKFEKIQRSNYLGHNFRSLGKITGSLFIYGHSLAENDRHILEQIKKNTSLKNLYISLYGEPTSPDNQRIVAAAKALATGRPKTKPLAIDFYCARSAHVWSA